MSLAIKIAKIVRGLTSRRNRKALRAGVGLAIGHEYVLGAVNWRTIVDIGANKGQFALAALDVQPGVTLHSFEPLARPGRIFKQVLRAEPNVHFHPFAVGPQNESASMHVAGLDHSSSLLPIGCEQTALFPATREVGAEDVVVKRLDAVLKAEQIVAPALLKLDVQGFEYDALCGCETLLDQFDTVYVECSFRELYVGQRLAGDVVAWLNARGFRFADLIGVYNDSSGRTVQGDFLFKRQPSGEA